MPAETGGIAELALITAVTVGLPWLFLHLDEVLTGAVRSGRRIGVLRPVPPTPDGMPIERIVADLRRIRPQARCQEWGMPMARRRGIVAAYDEALLDACRALRVSTELDRVTEPLERESERLRTEAELERAGVDLGSPHGQSRR